MVYFHTYIIYHCPVQVVTKSSKINFFRLKIVEIPTFLKFPEKIFKKVVDTITVIWYSILASTDTVQSESVSFASSEDQLLLE